MKRKFLTLCIAALLLLSCVVTGSAEEFEPDLPGSVTVTLKEPANNAPIVGAELSVYHIATVAANWDQDLEYTFTEAFANAGLQLDDPALAANLDAYLSENDAPATRICTDDRGVATCQDLYLGLYFIRQTKAVEGYCVCRPFLVTVPMEGPEGYVYDVDASPKTEVLKLIPITIRKVWNTNGSAKAADSVTVELLWQEQVVQTAVLNESNNWQVTFPHMPQSDTYRIQEVNVPKGFTATYSQNGYVFTVTNTATLAQTGQLIWPIPALAILGILFLAAASVLLRKKRDANG